jgi:pimeloyl-ACP methyl ester carboxylesterase
VATFVLVPGTFHDGWCWKKVVPLLRASGHVVYTPTLTGLGERSHLLSHKINLDTHIKDVVNLIEFEDFTDIILVGHSYGAGVVQGVAEIVPADISHLVSLEWTDYS